MSQYLPRFHFAGDFQADPSTVNNDPTHYDTSTFRSSFQLPEDSDSPNGSFNPNGSHSFRFYNCQVTSAITSIGTRAVSDTLIGAPLHDGLAAPPAKLADLDPHQQLASCIWGLALSVGFPSKMGLEGDFEPAYFSDLWQRTNDQAGELSALGSVWQSVVCLRRPIQPGDSKVLQEIAKQAPEALMMRFVVDGYELDRNSPRFTYGRVVGTFSPYRVSNPRYFPAGRTLRVASPSANDTNFRVNTAFAEMVTCQSSGSTVVTVDLGNSLPTASVRGPLIDGGALSFGFVEAGGVRIVGPEISYTEDGWYDRTAGMVSFSVSKNEADLLEKNPLCFVVVPRRPSTNGDASRPPDQRVLLVENQDGVYVRADEFAFHMQPDSSFTTIFYATKFGVPLPGLQIYLRHDSSIMASQAENDPLPVGEPVEALSFPEVIKTGADGTASLHLTAGDPGNPRQYLDGQVYGIAYRAGAPPEIGTTRNSSDVVNVHVFEKYTVVQDPTWVGQIQSLFAQYANLYPVMRPMVDLGSYASVMSRLQAMKIVFFNDIRDSNYMPVIRDMSEAKRCTVQNWLFQIEPQYVNPCGKEELCKMLQLAIELEHSTIPVYLAALYSIKPGRNVEVAAAIRSVVIEEMLHMALIANLLLSIGGKPKIGAPGFIPWYPGPLPGGVATGLTARLRKCSIDQIRDVFMAIETPGTLAIISNGEAIPGGPTESTDYTIGWFYEQISVALKEQKHSLKFGQNLEKQPEGWEFEDTKLFKIDSFESAERAIQIIVLQGEGQGAYDPTDDDFMGLSHYYKFAEIVAGRRLVSRGPDKHGVEQFSYSGSTIPFEEDGVYNAMDDPVLSEYPNGTRARVLAESFADTYQTMLNNLDVAFNGKPDTLGHAIGIMYTLSAEARELMQTPSGRNDGTMAGIAFQPPVDVQPRPTTGYIRSMKTRL